MEHLLLYESFSPDSRKPLYIDKHGKNIVWENDNGIMIAVDDIEDAKYISLWDKHKKGNKKIGFLTLSSIYTFGEKKFTKIGNIEIDKKYRGQKFGYLLYKMALKYLSPNSNGLVSYLPDRANKKQIPSIYKKFKNKIINDDYHIIYK